MNLDESMSFGGVLKAAREEKNISVSSISETLKLSIEKIEKIESSDFSSLPPAAFTCGYLRQFAKLVDLDEEQVIHLYNLAIGVEVAEGPPGTVSDLPAQASSNDLSMRIVSYSLGLVVIVLLVLWYQGSQEIKSNNDAAGINLEVDATNEASIETKDEVALVKTESQEVFRSDLKTPKDENESLASAAVNIVSDVETQVSSQVESEALSQIEDTKKVEAIIDSDEDLEKNKNIALAKEANPVAESGNDIVTLTANDNCWVEITDANKHLLYFSLLKKGEKAELKGQQPFSVFLGKATAVSITLNDIEFDVSKFVRSNQVARFTMSMDVLLENQVRQDVIINSANESQSSLINDL